MICINHPGIMAYDRCHYCKQPVCADCSKEDRGLLVCPRCYESLNAPADTCDESSPHVAAVWAIILSVGGLVFFGLGLFSIGLFYILSFGLVVTAVFIARDVKRSIYTLKKQYDATLANVALWISTPLIIWMSLNILYGIFLYIVVMFVTVVD